MKRILALALIPLGALAIPLSCSDEPGPSVDPERVSQVSAPESWEDDALESSAVVPDIRELGLALERSRRERSLSAAANLMERVIEVHSDLVGDNLPIEELTEGPLPGFVLSSDSHYIITTDSRGDRVCSFTREEFPEFWELFAAIERHSAPSEDSEHWELIERLEARAEALLGSLGRA